MITEAQRITNDIKHYRRQMSLNHENALKKLNYASKYLMDGNMGQTLFYVNQYKEIIEKNMEFVKMISQLVNNYYRETLKEVG